MSSSDVGDRFVGSVQQIAIGVGAAPKENFDEIAGTIRDLVSATTETRRLLDIQQEAMRQTLVAIERRFERRLTVLEEKAKP